MFFLLISTGYVLYYDKSEQSVLLKLVFIPKLYCRRKNNGRSLVHLSNVMILSLLLVLAGICFPVGGITNVFRIIRILEKRNKWYFIRVTVSIGLADTEFCRDIESCEVIDWADKALYAVKEQGRNRVIVYSSGMND